ncbi:hypothetical protein OBV_12530 [Oscillibacter valericigenes Sjm18-20]|nr:hypothetical protein OBV_12530 [Oscillibacter valericigenes Sjm18-20]
MDNQISLSGLNDEPAQVHSGLLEKLLAQVVELFQTKEPLLKKGTSGTSGIKRTWAPPGTADWGTRSK